MRTMAYRRRRFFIAPVILLALALFSALTMALWNALMPIIFRLPMINYWQAVGLLILGRLFFGGGRHHYGGWHSYYWRHGLKEKLAKMSPEERREYFRKLHYYHKSWHSEHWDETETGPEKDKQE